MDKQRPDMIRGKSLHAMTTEELEELLRLEQDTDREPDVDLIEEILAVLDSRTEAPSVDVDAAWEDFKENYRSEEPLYPMPEEQHSQPKIAHKKKFFRVAIVAAVLAVVVLSISATASATWSEIWNAIAQWSSETLGLEFGKQEKVGDPYNPELHELIIAVFYVDPETPLVPHYLPDGYKQAELHIEGDAIIGRYDKGNSYIFIQYRKIFDEYGGEFQRDANASEAYSYGGVEHYISTNHGNHLVAWANNGWECSIVGVRDKQALIRMIDSIYTEESSWKEQPNVFSR